MDYIVRPNIVARGAGMAAGGQETPQDRLLKYIPLGIAAAYPILENGIAEYVKTPVKGIEPTWIELLVFCALLVWYALFLHQKFNKEPYKGKTRAFLQTSQTAVSVIAFVAWTYSIKSAIWAPFYNPGLALIATSLFVLFASLYTPTVSPDQSQGGA